MKTFKEFINEKKQLDEFWLLNDSLKRILKGEDSYAYHGTNRDFDKFDMSFLREWRADKFLGKGIFLTPDKYVAEKYADSGANRELPLKILDDAKKIDNRLGDFMNSLYYKGNITWNMDEFKWVHDNWIFPIDPNDVATIVNLIPNSQSEKDYNKDSSDSDDGFFNFFNTSVQSLSKYEIRDLKKLGLGDYNPKIYTVYIKGTKSVLCSNSIKEIKNSNHDIVIAFDVPDLVQDVPEIIVRNINLLSILQKKRISTED